MPLRSESGQRLFAVLEEYGWTDGDSVRLAPLLRWLNDLGPVATRGQLQAVLYNGQEPTRALLARLARRLMVPPSRLLPPRPPAPRHPIEAINLADAIDDVRVKKRREEAKRYRKAKKRRVRQ
jgi:transcriptional regulator with XRE-family HTH domain